MNLEINASTVQINGQTVAVAKRPKYKRGTPKIKTNTSLIGDSVKVTQAKDYSEAIGEVTIALRNTTGNITLLEDWQDNIGKNAVRMIDSETGFTKTFNQMSISEDVEIDFDSEEFEVTFQGGQGK